VTTLRRNTVDLHCHTQRSDGVLPPLELYAQMRHYGMHLVAITDHDSLAACRELRDVGLGESPTAAGPQVIPAVEINTIGGDLLTRRGMGRDGEELHILGFGLDIDDPALVSTLERQRLSRRTRIVRTVELLGELGYPLEGVLDGVIDIDALGRPHVARALVRAGFAESVDDAFDRFLDYGQPGYVPRQGIGPREAIDAIRGARGLPVLAHSPGAPDRAQVMDDLQAWGLAGLEVYYRTFAPETVKRMAAFAKSRGLLATGGSDYHGDTMDYAHAQQMTYVPPKVGERLLEAIAGLRSAFP
jgi:predicted metal-dependent phosphoesterase TrpH